jgi:hypothetical protein
MTPRRLKLFSIVVLALFFSVFLVTFVFAQPNGAKTVTQGGSTRASAGTPDNNSAQAGNLTEITIFGYSTTESWQAYYGNVSGTIQLANANGKVMYNWSIASPEGEIYSSVAGSITWTDIACFNMTANLTDLEAAYNISSDDVDGVDETFNLNDHAVFYTDGKTFTSGQCSNTKLYNNESEGSFDEVLMTDGGNTVFAALLQENAPGFDSNSHDFEMLVLEDGHDADTTTTPYFFYIELQ